MVASFEYIPGITQPDSTSRWLDTAIEATKADPKNAEPYWLVGVGYARTGQTELGMPACQTALELNPNMDCGYVCAGLVHLARDEPEEAIPFFQYSLKLNPRFRPFTKEKYLGLAYIQSEQDDLAIAALGRALAAAPMDAFANFAMSAALALDGRTEDAREHLEGYLRESGTARPSLEGLGAKLEWMGAKTDRMLRGLRMAGL